MKEQDGAKVRPFAQPVNSSPDDLLTKRIVRHPRARILNTHNFDYLQSPELDFVVEVVHCVRILGCFMDNL